METTKKKSYATATPTEKKEMVDVAVEKAMTEKGFESFVGDAGEKVYLDVDKPKDVVESKEFQKLSPAKKQEIMDVSLQRSGYEKLETKEGKEVYVKTAGATPYDLSKDTVFQQLPMATQRELTDKAMFESGYYVNEPETGLPRYQKMSPETSLYGMHKAGTLQAMPEKQQKAVVKSRLLQTGYDVETVDGRSTYVPNPEKQARYEAAYWESRPQAQRFFMVTGRSMIWAGSQIITFPELLIEEGGGRLVTGHSVNVLPFREEFDKYTSIGYSTPGLEAAGFGIVMGDYTAWNLVRKHPLEAFFATVGEILGEIGAIGVGYGAKGVAKVGVGKLRTGLAKHGINLPHMSNLSPGNIYERIKLKLGKTKEISEDVLHQPGYDIGHTPGKTPSERISYVIKTHKGTKYIDDIIELNPRKGYVTGHGTGFKPASNIILETDEVTGKLVLKEVKAWDVIAGGVRGESPGISTAPIGEVSRHWYRGNMEFDTLSDYFSKTDVSLLPKVKRRPELATFESVVPAKKVSAFNPRSAAELKPFAKELQEELGYRNPFYQRTGEYIKKNVDVGQPVIAPKMYAGGIEQEILFKEATKTVPIKTAKPLRTVLRGEGGGTVVRISPRAVVEAGETSAGLSGKLKTIGEVVEEMKPSPLKNLLTYSETSSKPFAIVSPSKVVSKAAAIVSSPVSSKGSSEISSPLSSLKSKLSSKKSSAVSVKSAISSPSSVKSSSPSSIKSSKSALSSVSSSLSSGKSSKSSKSATSSILRSSTKVKKPIAYFEGIEPKKLLDKIKLKNPLAAGARERGHPVKLLSVKKTFSTGGMKII